MANTGQKATEPDAAITAAIVNDPRYRQLLRRRSRFATLLSVIMLTLYFGYILLVAFCRDWLARPIGDGVTSIGIPIGIGIIVAGIVLTALYIRRANREYDPLVAAIRQEHGA